DRPYRIEFFGDEIDSIRSFDIETQLSVDSLKKIDLIPNIANKSSQEHRESFLDFIHHDTIVFLQNTQFLKDRVQHLFEKAQDAFTRLEQTVKHLSPEEMFVSGEELTERLFHFTSVCLNENPDFVPNEKIDFLFRPQPTFNKQFDLLIDNLNTNHQNGFVNYLYCTGEAQANRFHDIFENFKENGQKQVIAYE